MTGTNIASATDHLPDDERWTYTERADGKVDVLIHNGTNREIQAASKAIAIDFPGWWIEDEGFIGTWAAYMTLTKDGPA